MAMSKWSGAERRVYLATNSNSKRLRESYEAIVFSSSHHRSLSAVKGWELSSRSAKDYFLLFLTYLI